MFAEPAPYVFEPGETMAVDISALWTDPEGNALTCTLIQSDGTALDATAMAFDAANNEIDPGTLDPIDPADENATFYLTSSCSDEFSTVIGLVTVIINDIPQVNNGVNDVTVLTNQPVTISLPTDAFSDNNAYNLTVDASPTGMTYDPTSHSWTGTPTTQ